MLHSRHAAPRPAGAGSPSGRRPPRKAKRKVEPDPTRLPNLLIVGAQKAGTTWIHNRLAEHPDVFMSERKELNFFNRVPAKRVGRRLEEYMENFDAAGEHKYRGESSVGYFWTHHPGSPYAHDSSQVSEHIARNAAEILGHDVRIVVSLRHPVDRAISAYFHHFRMGRLRGDESILEAGRRFGIIDMGFYRRHLRSWIKEFGFGRTTIVFFEHIRRDPQAVLDTIAEELDLTPLQSPKLESKDNSGFELLVRDDALTIDLDSHEPKNRSLAKKRLTTLHDQYVVPVIKRAEIAELSRIYARDVGFVCRQLGRCDWKPRLTLDDYARS